MSGAIRPYHARPAEPGNNRAGKHNLTSLMRGEIKRCKSGFCVSCDSDPEGGSCKTLTAYREGLLLEVGSLDWLTPLTGPMVMDFVNVSLALFQADRFLGAFGSWEREDGADGVDAVKVSPVVTLRNQLSVRLERLSEKLGITPSARLEIESRLRAEGEEDLKSKYLETQAREVEE